MDSGNHSEEFFAALDTKEIAAELTRRVDTWHNVVKGSGLYKRMLKAHRTYYGLTNVGTTASSEIRRAGENEELALMVVNHFRNLIQHLLVLVFNQRVAMEARAMNTDVEAQQQCVLANGVLDFYMREKHLEKHMKKAAELALVYSEGFLGMRWETQKGAVYAVDPDTQQPMHEGEIELYTISPLDVVRDPYARSSDDMDWCTVTRYVNRWNLIAKFPELKEKILACNDERMRAYRADFMSRQMTSSDLVAVYEFYHAKSEALPEGRYVQYLDNETVMIDTPLPYKRIPVFRVTPGDMFETPFGFTPAFDIMGLQDAYNILHSTVTTNQAAFGVQNILVPQGGNIAVTQVAGGMNFIPFNPGVGEPKPLQLLSTPPEIFNYMTMLASEMELLMGINSVVRGNPDSNLKSGSALALVASQAIQFSSGFQQSIVEMMESAGTCIVEILQMYAKTERMATIVGKDNQWMLKSFTGEDLNKVNKVVIDVANPLTKTKEGRLEIANQLLQAGMVKRPEQYLNVMNTGKLDPILDHERNEIMLISQENEMLAQGEIPQAVFCDCHAQHIREHKGIMSAYTRRSPEVASAIAMHIQQHIDLLKTTDPMILAMMGEQPIQAPMPPPMGAPEGMPQMAGTTDPTMQAAQNVNQPSMPENALTGQQYNPQTGGL